MNLLLATCTLPIWIVTRDTAATQDDASRCGLFEGARARETIKNLDNGTPAACWAEVRFIGTFYSYGSAHVYVPDSVAETGFSSWIKVDYRATLVREHSWKKGSVSFAPYCSMSCPSARINCTVRPADANKCARTSGSRPCGKILTTERIKLVPRRNGARAIRITGGTIVPGMRVTRKAIVKNRPCVTPNAVRKVIAKRGLDRKFLTLGLLF